LEYFNRVDSLDIKEKKVGKVVAMTGNVAVAEAMRQINPDVCAAYPITPSTEIMQEFSSFVAEGLVDTELVAVESEHSAMSACIGASAAGGRVMTATSAQGLALMWEMLYVAASCRLPIVMTVVNRALNAPLNIHCDHSDSMGARDAGWIQIYSENAQEAYDNIFQAVRIGQDSRVRLPVMVCLDGFIISHSIERMELMEDKELQKFIGPHNSFYPLLDTDHPVTYGPVDLQDYYTEHKRQQVEAMKNAREVILEIAEEFKSLSGREYGFFKEYCLEDAEIAILVLGSAGGTVERLKTLKGLAILDRSDSFGAVGGPVFNEVRSALLGLKNPPKVINYIYGLGGRDLGLEDLGRVYQELQKIASNGQITNLVDYLTVRE
jgi:pyruvate ferredoxin oxidoreductase alpha subunit